MTNLKRDWGKSDNFRRQIPIKTWLKTNLVNIKIPLNSFHKTNSRKIIINDFINKSKIYLGSKLIRKLKLIKIWFKKQNTLRVFKGKSKLQ